MFLKFFRIFIFISVFSAIAVWLANIPGRAVIEWLGWRIETSVPILLLLFFILFSVFFSLRHVIRRFFILLGRGFGHDPKRIQAKGYELLAEAVLSVAKGEIDKAKKLTMRAEKMLLEAPVAQLLSAQAAEMAGNLTSAEEKFKALSQHAQTELVGYRGLINYALMKQEEDKALDMAKKMFKKYPKTDWLAHLLMNLQAKKKLWEDIQETIKRGAKKDVFSHQEKNRLLAVALTEQAFLEKQDQQMPLLKQAHDLDPTLIVASLELAKLYMLKDEIRHASHVIEKTWESKPHPALGKLYVQLWKSQGQVKLLEKIEKLQRLNPEHQESTFVLIEALLQIKMYSRVEKMLKDLLKAHSAPDRTTALFMARLKEEQDPKNKEAQEWLEKALSMESAGSWRCSSCHTHLSQWNGVCSSCHSFGCVNWHYITGKVMMKI